MSAVRSPRVLLALWCVVVLVGGAGVAAASQPEWNVARIGAPRSAAGVVIAVVDSGVDPAHPVFGGRVLPQIDVVGDGRDGDPNGHGTHVAGTAAGADNGCGSIGVAPDARILPVRVLDEHGSGTLRDVAEGIRRATDAGAHVINLSLGEDVVIRNVAGSGLDDAIEYAWSKGAVPVLAAGNDGIFGALLGSGYEDLPAVVVTATDNQDRIAPYATPVGGARWGIAAPGGDGSGEEGRDIRSAYPDRACALLAGTSMAAPHVSASLAVLRRMGLSPQQAVERILATARDVGSERTYGAGLLDLAAAVGASQPTTAAPPSTPPPPTAAPTTQATAAPATTSEAPSTTGAAPTTGRGADGAAPSTSPPTSTTGAPEVGPAELDPSTTSTSTTAPADELATDVVVTDEDEDRPGTLLVVVAGALVVSAGAGVALLRARRPGQP